MLCNKKAVGQTNGLVNSGGDKRDRTADLLNAIQALSQLSYTPVYASSKFLSRRKIVRVELTRKQC